MKYKYKYVEQRNKSPNRKGKKVQIEYGKKYICDLAKKKLSKTCKIAVNKIAVKKQLTQFGHYGVTNLTAI
jgi:hypothetical protein